MFESLGQYDKVREYHEKALAISIEIGDRNGEATSYGNLGTLFQSLGQYDKAREYQEKALAIRIEIGDRDGEATSYGNLGTLFQSLGRYREADDYLKKAMAVRKGIDDRTGEASDYISLGAISYKRGEYDKAQEDLQKALTICMDIGAREKVVVCYNNLGLCYQSLGKNDIAEGYLKEALLLSRDIGHNFNEFGCLCNLSVLMASQGHLEEASSYLFQGIQKFETLRGFLKENDQFQISLLEEHGTFPYMLFSRLLSSTGKPQDALYVEELRRAKGLADLMATQYSVQEQISSDPQSWCGIQGIITKEADCACLYISVGKNEVRFWIIKATGAIHFSEKKVNLDQNQVTGIVPDLDEYFKEAFRSYAILPEQKCEDRSLDDTELMSLHYDNLSVLRDYDAEDFKTSLHLCYKIIIAPVASLLKQPEIIIVPDSCVYQVPFAALVLQTITVRPGH